MPVIARALPDRLPSVSATRPCGRRRLPPRLLPPLLLLVATLGAGRAQAAAPAVEGLSEQGQAALQHLLQPQAVSGAARPDAAASTVMRQQVVVQRGETLDRVIARTLRDSPFRVEVLREAYLRVNRGAFPRGSPHTLAAGATLAVPNVADVLGVVDPQRQMFAPPAPPPPPPAAARATGPTPEADRRSWIRYP